MTRICMATGVVSTVVVNLQSDDKTSLIRKYFLGWPSKSGIDKYVCTNVQNKEKNNYNLRAHCKKWKQLKRQRF